MFLISNSTRQTLQIAPAMPLLGMDLELNDKWKHNLQQTNLFWVKFNL